MLSPYHHVAIRPADRGELTRGTVRVTSVVWTPGRAPKAFEMKGFSSDGERRLTGRSGMARPLKCSGSGKVEPTTTKGA